MVSTGFKKEDKKLALHLEEAQRFLESKGISCDYISNQRPFDYYWKTFEDLFKNSLTKPVFVEENNGNTFDDSLKKILNDDGVIAFNYMVHERNYTKYMNRLNSSYTTVVEQFKPKLGWYGYNHIAFCKK